MASGAILLALLAVALVWWFRENREHSQDRVIAAAAARYGMDPALVKAVVWRESDFDPAARGRAGELGLMQVTDAAAQEWAEAERVYPLPLEHLLDPATNTLAGTWYLRKLLQRYRATANALPFALADYNAGRGNVLKWMKAQAATNDAAFLAQIGFPSTRDYVQAVMQRHAQYGGEGGLRAAP
jgi:soluble lytic murein transglycosylase